MKDGHVTIYDVAARAGVHASTASRALSGLKVKAVNQIAVEEAAAALGYVPNEAARSLRVVKTMTVGMVFHELTSALGVELLGAVSAALDKAGFSLFVSTAQGSAERYDQLVRRFLERRVDALLCVHGRGEGEAVDRFVAAGIPTLALISKAGEYARLPLVYPSVRAASDDCVRALVGMGHARIGVVTLPRPIQLTRDFIEAAGDRAVVYNPRRHPTGAIDALGLLEDLRRLPERPTVLVALLADATAIFETAEKVGLKVPQSLSLVAIRDRSVQAQPTRAPLSMIHVDPTKAGARVGEILVDWLDNKTPWSGDLAVPAGSWREGATTANARR